MKKVGKNILKGVIYLIIPIIIELLFSKKVILEKSTLIRLAMLYERKNKKRYKFCNK